MLLQTIRRMMGKMMRMVMRVIVTIKIIVLNYTKLQKSNLAVFIILMISNFIS